MLRISWSSVRTHGECKQRGALLRAGKRMTISDSRSFFPGNIVDRVVRDWLNDDPYSNAGAMPAMVPLVIDRELARIKERGGLMKWRGEEDRALVEADCIEAVTKIEPALEREVLPHDYMVDWRFEAPLAIPGLPDEDGNSSLEYITLTGAMDIAVRTQGGEFAVLDVKMTRDSSYWKKTVGQLAFYDLSIFAMYGVDTQKVGLLQPMCPEEVLWYQLDDNRRSFILGRVIEMCHDVWRGDDTPTGSGYMCTVCDTKAACSKFKPVMKNGKKTLDLF